MPIKTATAPDFANGRTPDGRRTISITEAARVLGVGRTTAYLMAQTGELPTIKARGRVLVSVAALERLLTGGDGVMSESQ